ncbi:hypothetical protein A3Q56_05922 [Intoshia linei]|uniref:Uncharacterized protein n=1 Tax=Intoshia linei TaxID=1819745 RepID=A0A177AYA6_9BILA|nr:hypothetical protein A3Q56_05922 [Intoshia linei]
MEIDLLIQNQIRTTKLEPKMASHFDPYDMNGGSVVAISGDNFAIIGSDTRLSQSYNILSRNVPKISTIGNDIAIGMSGFHGDIITFKKKIKSIVKGSH